MAPSILELQYQGAEVLQRDTNHAKHKKAYNANAVEHVPWRRVLSLLTAMAQPPTLPSHKRHENEKCVQMACFLATPSTFRANERDCDYVRSQVPLQRFANFC